MTTGSTGSDDDYWRRPAEATGPEPAPPSDHEPATDYTGPPPSAAPPPDWRPMVVNQLPPPRHLPRQDPDRLDADERSARTVTYGIAMIAGAVLVVVSCLLCSRVLF